MKLPSPIVSFPTAVLLAALGASRLPGQTVPPPLKPADEPIERLSPFMVTTDRDTGYQATSTLAGTRLNTKVEDLAAAISIYTKELMDDIGATSSSDLLVFAT